MFKFDALFCILNRVPTKGSYKTRGGNFITSPLTIKLMFCFQENAIYLFHILIHLLRGKKHVRHATCCNRRWTLLT